LDNDLSFREKFPSIRLLLIPLMVVVVIPLLVGMVESKVNLLMPQSIRPIIIRLLQEEEILLLLVVDHHQVTNTLLQSVLLDQCLLSRQTSSLMAPRKDGQLFPIINMEEEEEEDMRRENGKK
jgi:hypothetical protein